MPYDVRYSKEALQCLKELRPYDRAAILDQTEQILTVNPTLVSKVTVKLLRQPAPTQYRLRVGDYRVYYDVDQGVVWIIRILSKDESISYLGEGP